MEKIHAHLCSLQHYLESSQAMKTAGEVQGRESTVVTQVVL